MNELQRLKGRDPQLWRCVLQEHMPQLLGYTTRMVGGRSQAEDIVQSALANVLASIDGFEGRCSIKSWLFRAVHNKAVDHLRERRRWVHAPDGDVGEDWFDKSGRWASPPQEWHRSADAQLDAKAKLAVVRCEIDKLPHLYRQVILLKDVHQNDNREIARMLELSPGNLRIRLHRARKALRIAVDHALGED